MVKAKIPKSWKVGFDCSLLLGLIESKNYFYVCELLYLRTLFLWSHIFLIQIKVQKSWEVCFFIWNSGQKKINTLFQYLNWVYSCSCSIDLSILVPLANISSIFQGPCPQPWEYTLCHWSIYKGY